MRAAANEYRARAFECLSLAEGMNDPECRARFSDMLDCGCNWRNRSELLGVLMRWGLRLLPYQLWSNTTRGSKIFVTKAEYRVSAFGCVVSMLHRC